MFKWVRQTMKSRNTIYGKRKCLGVGAVLAAGTMMLMGAGAWWEEELLQVLLQGPPSPDDPRLLRLVRQKYVVAPSTAPYNLKEESGSLLDNDYLSYRNTTLGWQTLHKLVVELFEQRPAGFFVEAGALDGEYLSNTVYLERQKGWTGLLVEPDEDMFALLLKKNRRAWTSHSCLSAKPYPSETILVKMANSDQSDGIGYRAQNTLYGSHYYRVASPVSYEIYETVQCLPLQTLLLALPVTHVDFISLDVEGVEQGVVEAFWESGGLTVDVWLVEHHNPNTFADSRDDVFIDMFHVHGYSLYTIISDLQPFNYVFIRQNCDLHSQAFATRPIDFML
ncbi:uncharacterized protein [Procambarus clarkii]|uniref:uncharacterized protein n=1 Tax=Procambarus clarkii TaxID=6728 RepID=UPI003742AF99